MRLLKPGGQALIYVWAFEQEYNKQRSKYLKDQKDQHPENHSPTNNTSDDSQEPHKKSSIHTSRHLENSHRPVNNMQDVSKVTDGKLGVHTNRTSFTTQDLLVPWHLKEGNRRGEKEPGEGVKKDKRKENSKKTSENYCSAYSLTSTTRSDCNPDPSPGLEPNMSGSGQDTSNVTHGPESKTNASGDITQTSTSTPKSECESMPVPVFHRYYHVFQQGELEQLCAQVAGVKVQSSYHDQGNWCVILEKNLKEVN